MAGRHARNEADSCPQPRPEGPRRQAVLDDVTLEFLPGAKTGVPGPNGTGKSMLLRMMAGLEQPSDGEVRLTPSYTAGVLLQEPPLNEARTVPGNVEEGVAGTKALIERYSEAAGKLAAVYSDDLREELGRLQEHLDHRDARDLDSQRAGHALRCRPPRRPGERAVRRGAAACARCCCPSRTCSCSMSPPTTWTACERVPRPRVAIDQHWAVDGDGGEVPLLAQPA